MEVNLIAAAVGHSTVAAATVLLQSLHLLLLLLAAAIVAERLAELALAADLEMGPTRFFMCRPGFRV